jgi:hypothetical protein
MLTGDEAMGGVLGRGGYALCQGRYECPETGMMMVVVMGDDDDGNCSGPLYG